MAADVIRGLVGGKPAPAAELAEIARDIAGVTGPMDQQFRDVLDTLGIANKLDRKPRQLSGGEQQRVAIARSVVNHPAILLGRPVVCGYEGHLWSHGLDYREKLTKLRLVVDQAPGWRETAKEIGAKWVLPQGRKTPVKVSD